MKETVYFVGELRKIKIYLVSFPSKFAALYSRPKSLTLDTLLLIWLWSSTFGGNVLRTPPKKRFGTRGPHRDSEPEDHTHTPQQNLLFSGAGPGGGRVCAVTSFAELLIDPLRNYESEGKLAGQTDKHT